MKTQTMTYEQCPYDEEHVLAIYHHLKSVDKSGNWVRIEGCPGQGMYRVFEGRIFQALFSDSQSELLSAVMDLAPPEIEDDAEWTVERTEDGRHSLSSRFSITFGPFSTMDKINEDLAPFGLALVARDQDRYLQGVAILGQLTTQELGAAIEHLRWLEAVCMTVNQNVKALLTANWVSVAAIAKGKTSGAADGSPSFEVIPMEGPKRREPRPG